MEAQLQDITSASLEKPKIQNILSILEADVAKAQDMRDQATVQNANFRRALDVVETFLRKSKRVCQGGMAINAHLPDDMKFYNFSKVLPDYDFFTPDPKKDVQALVKALKEAGLQDVEAKLGIHKGTTKVQADFLAVADITEVSPEFQQQLLKPSITVDGIHQADANFLRMSMYLELSRPMGQVERWDKVYKRLFLLNNATLPPTTRCKKSTFGHVPGDIRNTLLRQLQQNSLVQCGRDLEKLQAGQAGQNDAWLKSHDIVVAQSENLFHDAKAIKAILMKQGTTGIRIQKWTPSDEEFVPLLVGIVVQGKLVAILVEQVACHSYNTQVRSDNSILRVASLDTLITLQYSLAYITSLQAITNGSAECIANRLVLLSHRTRDADKPGDQPHFSLTCTGHQPSKESLLKAKKERVDEFKKSKRKTKKNRR